MAMHLMFTGGVALIKSISPLVGTSVAASVKVHLWAYTQSPGLTLQLAGSLIFFLTPCLLGLHVHPMDESG